MDGMNYYRTEAARTAAATPAAAPAKATGPRFRPEPPRRHADVPRAEPPAAAGAPVYRARIGEPIVTGLAALSDVVGLVLGSAFMAGFGGGPLEAQERPLALMACLLGTAMVANLIHVGGGYRFAAVTNPGRTMGAVALGWVVVAASFFGAGALTGALSPSLSHWLVGWPIAVAVPMLAGRAGLAALAMRWKAQGRMSRATAIVGTGPIAEGLLLRHAGRPDAGYRIVGLYEDRNDRAPKRCAGHEVQGGTDQLIRDIRDGKVDTVILALPLSADRRLTQLMNKLGQVAVDTMVAPDRIGLQLGRCPTQQMGETTLIQTAERPLRDWRMLAKSVEDKVVGAMILMLIGPALIAIAIAVKMDSPGPVFFKQKRTGYNNRLIEMWKFRSMHHAMRDENAEKLTQKNDPRITRLGAFLRRTSLDELPQFINVVRGEMSIVGPRPHALSAKAGGLHYRDAVNFYDCRHRMKPGITGWAQVNGWRGETDTVNKIVGRVEHDLYYIEHWSVLMDLKIIFKTIFGGFTGRHAY